MDVHGERTERGLEFVLRPRGPGRFFGAGFLSFWLCGWAVGEAFAGWILFVGATSLLFGRPPGPGREPLAPGPALAMGCFLLVWLSLWTVGGLAAIRELLRLLWSEDRIVADPSRLRVLRKIGPFRTTIEIPREALRKLYLAPRRQVLSADTATGPVALTTLGSVAEREGIAAALTEELRVTEQRDTGGAPSLPEGWQEIVTPEGDVALVSDLMVRRKQSRVAFLATLFLATVALVLASGARSDPKQIGLAIVFSVLAAGLAWGTLRLARGRIEWRIGAGSLTRRYRFGAKVRDLHAGARLELTQAADGDGDDWFSLESVAADSPALETLSAARSWRRPGRIAIHRVMNDGVVVRRLGAWLAERSKMPLVDLATREALATERARALAQLRDSGAFGRRLAGFIERFEGRRGS